MHNAALVRPLDAAEDRAVTAVLLRYANALDMRDWPLFRSCFTEDVEAEYTGFGRWRGPREITEFMRATHLDVGPTLHRITNISIWREEDDVRARCYVDAILMPVQPGGAVQRGIGWYDDRLARTSEGWKISRRVFTPILLK